MVEIHRKKWMNRKFLNVDSFNFSILGRLIVRYMVEIHRKNG